MKTQFLLQKIKYDGSQLKPLSNYLEHGLLGSSVVAWLGPCSVTAEHMIDGEDLRAKKTIAADEMAHFIFEIFDLDLKSGIFLQRLMAEIVSSYLRKTSTNTAVSQLVRCGDDLYLQDKKLNISIATVSANSCLIHFAVNVLPTGAPVPILCLQDLGVPAEKFCKDVLLLLQTEIVDIFDSSYKVRVF